MNQDKQAEALRLADALTDGRTPSDGLLMTVSAALRRQHARIAELEASQAQRVPLSDEEIDSLWPFSDLPVPQKALRRLRLIARTVEAAHNITQEKQQ